MAGLRDLIGCNIKVDRFTNTCALRLGAARLVDRAVEPGYPRGAKCSTRQFPDVPESCLAALVRGYFDGDGGVGHNQPGRPRLRFASNARDFVAELARRIAVAGLGSRLVNAWTTQPGQYSLHYGVILSRGVRDWMYADGGYCMQFKREAPYG